MRPLALVLLLTASCSENLPASSDLRAGEAQGLLVVYTVNRPLAYFAERIGGDLVRVRFPAPRDVDPAFWAPPREVIAEYQNADLILLNGADYAKWVGHASLPHAVTVDTSSAFSDRLLARADAVAHRHGPEGEHDHGETAFTTWLDPELAIEHARAVLQAFERERPDERAAFAAGFEALRRDLLQLDENLSEAFAGDAALLASHPVYQYLARAYDLDLRSLHWEPDVAPTDDDWRELEALLSVQASSVMLWEGEPLPGTAARLGELGVAVAVLDPRGNGEGDLVRGLSDDVERLRALLTGD